MRSLEYLWKNNRPAKDFARMEFSCRSGGSPVDKVGLAGVSSSSSPAYDTVACGRAWKGISSLICRPIGYDDDEGRQVYEDTEGTMFVYDYSPGNAWCFDSAAFRYPALCQVKTAGYARRSDAMPEITAWFIGNRDCASEILTARMRAGHECLASYQVVIDENGDQWDRRAPDGWWSRCHMMDIRSAARLVAMIMRDGK